MAERNVVDMDERLNRLWNSRLESGGDPPYDGGMEARVAKLEASVAHIESDVREIKSDLRGIVRWGLASFAGGFVLTWAGLFALAALIANGFGWL